MRHLTLLALSLLVGCSTASRDAYYDAVAKTAAAQAAEAQARYEALMLMAANGNGEASAVAAVMAIAMNQPEYATPRYVPSETLSWVQALAAPVSSLAAVWINADLLRDNNKQNTRVNIRRIAEDAQTQRALYQRLTQTQPVAQPDTSSADIATRAFEALEAVSGQSLRGYDAVETIVGEALDHIHVDGGCCPTCGTCEPEPPPADPDPTAGDDGGGGLCVSPCNYE